MELDEIEELARSGNHAQALRLIDEMIRRGDDGHKVWAARAYINGRGDDRDATILDWTKAIQLCEEPHYVYMRGIEFFQSGRYREAVSDFTRVIQLSDVYKSDYYRGPAYFFRADAHLRLKEFEKARSDLSHVRDDMQTWTDRLRTKADILAECG